jgi:hypothetical protein
MQPLCRFYEFQPESHNPPRELRTLPASSTCPETMTMLQLDKFWNTSPRERNKLFPSFRSSLASFRSDSHPLGLHSHPSGLHSRPWLISIRINARSFLLFLMRNQLAPLPQYGGSSKIILLLKLHKKKTSATKRENKTCYTSILVSYLNRFQTFLFDPHCILIR